MNKCKGIFLFFTPPTSTFMRLFLECLVLEIIIIIVYKILLIDLLTFSKNNFNVLDELWIDLKDCHKHTPIHTQRKTHIHAHTH